jgi:hypothetical protein
LRPAVSRMLDVIASRARNSDCAEGGSGSLAMTMRLPPSGS